MPYVECDRAELWYDELGEGQTVVVTGGWGIAHRQYEKVTPLLGEDFRVINWNWRGASRSRAALTEPYSIDRWTRDLEAVLDAAGVEQAFLWGTSSGSLISLHLAATRPERVLGVATWMQYRTDLAFRAAYELFPRVFEVFGYDGFTQLLSWLGLGTEARLTEEGNAFARWEREALEEVLSPLDVEPVCRAVALADLTRELDRVRCPVTILAGTDGDLGTRGAFGRAALEGMLRLMPQATVTEIPDAGGTYYLLQKPRESADAFKHWARTAGSTAAAGSR